MTSITILGIELIICLITIIILYKIYHEIGINIYISIAFILSSIMSLKIVNILNFDVNLGIVPFVTIFIATNILLQKKGPEEQKTIILTILGLSIISYLIMYLVSLMKSSNINLFTNASYDNLFNSNHRLFFANLVTVLYGLLINSKLYYYLKKMKNNIFISNIFSSIIIQFIAAILFILVAYTFELEFVEIIKLIMIRYLISLFVGLIGTICIYITKYIK